MNEIAWSLNSKNIFFIFWSSDRKHSSSNTKSRLPTSISTGQSLRNVLSLPDAISSKVSPSHHPLSITSTTFCRTHNMGINYDIPCLCQVDRVNNQLCGVLGPKWVIPFQAFMLRSAMLVMSSHYVSLHNQLLYSDLWPFMDRGCEFTHDVTWIFP